MELTMGRLVMTAGVNDQIAENGEFAKHVTRSMNRYMRHDWGEMAAEDKRANDAALESGEDRIFAAYPCEDHPDWKIWIITEWDRSVTTILFPSEY